MPRLQADSTMQPSQTSPVGTFRDGFQVWLQQLAQQEGIDVQPALCKALQAVYRMEQEQNSSRGPDWVPAGADAARILQHARTLISASALPPLWNLHETEMVPPTQYDDVQVSLPVTSVVSAAGCGRGMNMKRMHPPYACLTAVITDCRTCLRLA